MKHVCAIVAGLLTLAAPALAGTITISPFGGGISLNSGDLRSTVFGSTRPAWGVQSLASVHNALNASGIDTDGRITFVAADTDHGLALLVLVDRELGVTTGGMTGRVNMTSVASGAGIQYVNSIASPVSVVAAGAGLRAANASFRWNGDGGGDAFAWSNLEGGDALSFRFQRSDLSSGLLSTSTFQFVSWSGTAWERVSVPGGQNLFDNSGNYEFGALTAVPLPSAVLMGVLPLLGLSACHRRRSLA